MWTLIYAMVYNESTKGDYYLEDFLLITDDNKYIKLEEEKKAYNYYFRCGEYDWNYAMDENILQKLGQLIVVSLLIEESIMKVDIKTEILHGIWI